ncbi:hypothetical protein M438DRAFT_344358, partial [Aureobasidium pullulans EXF-150]
MPRTEIFNNAAPSEACKNFLSHPEPLDSVVYIKRKPLSSKRRCDGQYGGRTRDLFTSRRFTPKELERKKPKL